MEENTFIVKNGSKHLSLEVNFSVQSEAEIAG